MSRRILLFGDPGSWMSVALLGAALRCAAARDDVEVVGIVDVPWRGEAPLSPVRRLVVPVAQRAFNPATAVRTVGDPPLLWSCRLHARRHRVPLLSPGPRGVGDPAFVEEVRRLAPDASIAFMVAAIFGPELLEALRTSVNYHNGLLPQYRGVGATEWSVYNGEKRSGFAFHHMSEGVDEGAVLLQDAVAVARDATATDVERAKTALAADRVGAVLDLVVAGAAGEPQPTEGARIYRRSELAAASAVGDPASVTWEELRRRLRAFGTVSLELAGARVPVTAVRRVDGRRPPLAFVTADGVVAAPARLGSLPPAVYRSAQSLRGRGLVPSVAAIELMTSAASLQ